MKKLIMIITLSLSICHAQPIPPVHVWPEGEYIPPPTPPEVLEAIRLSEQHEKAKQLEQQAIISLSEKLNAPTDSSTDAITERTQTLSDLIDILNTNTNAIKTTLTDIIDKKRKTRTPKKQTKGKQP